MEYKLFSKKKKRNVFDQCVRCGICLGSCPVYHITRLETDSPRGRLELMRSLTENKAIPSHDCIVSLSCCLFCLKCQRNCPAGVEFDLSFLHTMELLGRIDNDAFKDPTHPRSVENIQTYSFVQIHKIEGELKGVKKRFEDVMIFPGCFVDLKEIKNIQSILKDKGIDTIMISEKICCGLPYLLNGNKKEALQCMKQNLKIFNNLKIKTLVTPCPFCIKMFAEYYPFFLNQKIDIEFKDISNFFPFKELKLSRKLSKKVAYHSPCLIDKNIASNHQQIIEQFAGDLYISLPAQVCCGHGFRLPSINEELSREICQRNLSKITGKGVQVLITDCPSCTTKWIKGIQESNLDLEVIPFWDLLLTSKSKIK